jgi:RimJ/RimL family protein N-acetyltransferase
MTGRRLRGGQWVCKVPFDETYLKRSAQWLQDPELNEMIRGAPYDPVAQRAWFEGLPDREDYVVWGMECDGVPVGVTGLKEIGVADGCKHWLYIADPESRGLGIGRWAFEEALIEIRARGYTWFYGDIAHDNLLSQRAHAAMGIRMLRDEGDTQLWGCPLDPP